MSVTLTKRNRKDIRLTYDQAQRAIKLCLHNAESFIQDAEILTKQSRSDHLAIPIEFAFEETGKAKIISDKLKSANGESIVISNSDGIFSHKLKLKKAVELLDIPNAKRMSISSLFGNGMPYDIFDIFVMGMIRARIADFRNKASTGHEMRLSSTFVDFDPDTNEPILAQTIDERHLSDLCLALRDIIGKWK